jgi:hypothetical protein
MLRNLLFLPQKKIILQTAPSGSVSVIDVVPLESSDSSDSQILVAESNGLNQNSQQVTAQVAVVQAQGSPNGQHFIAVSGKLCEYFKLFIGAGTHRPPCFDRMLS